LTYLVQLKTGMFWHHHVDQFRSSEEPPRSTEVPYSLSEVPMPDTIPSVPDIPDIIDTQDDPSQRGDASSVQVL